MRRPPHWALIDLLSSVNAQLAQDRGDTLVEHKPDFWAPVNMYDPTPDKVVKHILHTIEKDLEYLGEIEIRGTVTASYAGPLMHDVLAVIKNPQTFHYVQGLQVRWNQDTESLVYTNMDGRTFIPAPAPDPEDTGRRQGQAVVDKVMAYLRKTSGVDVERMRSHTTPTEGRVVVATMFAPTPIAGATLLLATPWNVFLEMGLLGATAAGSIALATKGLPAGRRIMEQVGEHYRDMRTFMAWRTTPDTAFDNLFETPNERSAFMNMVLDQCQRAEIIFDGKIRIVTGEWDRHGSMEDQVASNDVLTKGSKIHSIL